MIERLGADLNLRACRPCPWEMLWVAQDRINALEARVNELIDLVCDTDGTGPQARDMV